MEEALKEARLAGERGEVPVGAVIVYEGEVIARAHNRVEELQDATAHAEVLCLRLASSRLENWRLLKATLYCTLEPCSMCAGAMILSRLEKVVWGAPDLRHGAHGSWVNLLDQPHPIHQLKGCGGVMQKESSELLKAFFQKRRRDERSLV
jgi:tRNA(adenine34) deaminase